jgi:magnesium transporter
MSASENQQHTSPGTLQYIGSPIHSSTHINLVQFNEQQYSITPISDLSQYPAFANNTVHWLNVDGIHESQVVKQIGECFGLHNLLLEDVMNTYQKPKIEYFDDNTLFITLKMLNYNAYTKNIDIEHVSFVLKESILISFQEGRDKDIFEPVLERIKASAGKTRKSKADYLLYSLVDVLIDNYFSTLEKIEDRLDELEENIVSATNNRYVTELYALKRELTFVRKAVYPVREMMSFLLREDSALLHSQTHIYWRDLYDHITQTIDMIDAYRDLIAGLIDVHLSVQGNKMNQVMKTLTIISVIFLPLNLIVGYFGMNFVNMPELSIPHADRYVLSGMLIIIFSLLIYFKRKDWM